MATATPVANTVFDSNRVLLYNVQPWSSLGFGVPNFGSSIATQSEPIWRLVDEIGRNQLLLMTSQDARRPDYPSVNSIIALGKLINRVQTILAGRQRQPNEQRLAPLHAGSNPLVWNVHPVPFFQGPMVANPWLKEYNSLVMVALTNAMRHGDNNLSLTVTSDFASDIWPYFREIKVLCCTELLGMTKAQAEDDTQLFPTGPYNGPGTLPVLGQGTTTGGGTGSTQPTYNPPATVVNTQSLQTAGAVMSWPTSDDLQPLWKGIPANLLIPNLAQYPVGPIPGEDALSGEDTPTMAAISGVLATAGPGGAMGSPLGVTPAAKAVMDAVNAAIGPAPGTTTSSITNAGNAPATNQTTGGVIAPANV